MPVRSRGRTDCARRPHGAPRVGARQVDAQVPPQLQSLGLWVEQLVAESTGKQRKGIVPITGEAPDAIR